MALAPGWHTGLVRRLVPLLAALAALLAVGAGQAATLPRIDGAVVVVDPGHNLTNWKHPDEINRLVDAGTLRKPCDTTGTATASGYSEAAHNLDVAYRVKRLLEGAGATVILTHTRSDPPWGPCITERAAIGNRANADVAISIHADGHEGGGRGFHVIYPPSIAGLTDDIARDSLRFALRLRATFAHTTGMPFSTYTGKDALNARSDLGGLNLSDVPKVFIECGNMRDRTDAALLSSVRFRKLEALGIARGIARFLQ